MTAYGGPRFIVLWILYLLLPIVYSTASFELRLDVFKNEKGFTSNGNCCSGVRHSDGKCSANCSTFFWICLTHYQRQINEETPCTFTSVETPVLGANSINFSAALPVNFDNPQSFSIPWSWPGTFSLIIDAFHDKTKKGPTTGSPRDLISKMAVQKSVEVGTIWNTDVYVNPGTGTELNYSYRVLCDEHYYGESCSNLCTPRDDEFGHYNCDENGTKVCLNGWQGPYCSQAICKEGCHPDNGFCNTPNECLCRKGYTGGNCSECMTYPGCMQGTCEEPWQCNCNEGWGGLFCNQDLNYCTHHSPCQNGGICKNTGQALYECDCPLHFKGTNCEIEVDDCQSQSCLNGGTCQDTGNGYQCKCPEGFTGRQCDTIAISCDDKPCQYGATCMDVNNTFTGYTCLCAPGYTGYNCGDEINECYHNPCKNGRCIDELNGYRCECNIGFQGITCEQNINDCEPNPCLNDGFCVDKINGFECRCASGYVGSICQKTFDKCDLGPCANGGTCISQDDDFICRCPKGFYGKDCSSYKDECAKSPCENGGTCRNTQDDFECTCPKGFSGKDCSIRMDIATNKPIPGNEGKTESQTGKNINEDVITMTHLVLIICLGVGIPLVLLIIVAVFLLLRKRKKSPPDCDPHTQENVKNSSIVKNNFDSPTDSIFTTSGSHATSNSCSSNISSTKMINEDKDFNTYKANKLKEKATNKQLIHKDINTQNQHFSKRPPSPLLSTGPPIKETNKYSDNCNSASCSSQRYSSSADIHIIGAASVPGPSKNFKNDYEKHGGVLHRPVSFYSEDVLATEV